MFGLFPRSKTERLGSLRGRQNSGGISESVSGGFNACSINLGTKLLGHPITECSNVAAAVAKIVRERRKVAFDIVCKAEWVDDHYVVRNGHDILNRPR